MKLYLSLCFHSVMQHTSIPAKNTSLGFDKQGYLEFGLFIPTTQWIYKWGKLF